MNGFISKSGPKRPEALTPTTLFRATGEFTLTVRNEARDEPKDDKAKD